MKTKEQIKQLILENCVNEEGNIDLSGLDFSNFDGDVNISRMKVKKNLYQYKQEVKGTLRQDEQEVGRNLHQDYQKVKGNLFQNYQEAKGYLYQDCNCENN